jgi:DUF438 domain-containing protein
MSDLVSILKSEHQNIVKILTKVSDLGVDSKEGRQALLAAKTGLIAHLNREDEHLFPVLLKEAESDPILEDALDFFHEDIAGVTNAAIAFFDKYETDGENSTFQSDFSEVVRVLSQRIQKEESVLYRMYDKLVL